MIDVKIPQSISPLGETAVKMLSIAAIAALIAWPAQASLTLSDSPTSNVDCNAGVCIANAAVANLNATDLTTLLASSDVRVLSETNSASEYRSTFAIQLGKQPFAQSGIERRDPFAKPDHCERDCASRPEPQWRHRFSKERRGTLLGRRQPVQHQWRELYAGEQHHWTCRCRRQTSQWFDRIRQRLRRQAGRTAQELTGPDALQRGICRSSETRF